MKELHLSLGDRSYPIFVGSGLLGVGHLSLWSKFLTKQVLIVSNQSLIELYGETLRQNLSSLGLSKLDVLALPDGEQFKNLDTLNLVFDRLLEKNFNRTATLVALGGGVIGDMTGFAAACYQRGIHFVQIPTTLLSQVDSSVGGKTGVNHALGKNMIGAFYQPKCVLIDTDVLETLPDKELSAGLAEVIKYGLIYDRTFFHWLEENANGIAGREEALIAHAIYRSCEIKAEVVASDEKESGIRAILNLGHTFGHAIETHQGYGAWLHGEAVAVGMLMACDLSVRLGWLDEKVSVRAKALCLAFNLPTETPAGMTPADFMKHMSVDKKVLNKKLRLVLLTSLGEAVVTEDFNSQLLERTLEHFCSG